jgi:hypothetical protein
MIVFFKLSKVKLKLMMWQPIMAHLIAVLFSVALLYSSAIDSPLWILHRWENAELFRLFGIFLFLYSLQYLCKFFKAKIFFPVLTIILAVLIQFNIASVTSVALLAFTAAVIGRRVTFGSQWFLKSEIAMHIAVGYSILIGILQITAHFPINTRGLFTLASFALLILLHRETTSLSADIFEWLRKPFEANSVAFVLPVGVALCMLLYVAMPETHSDALILNLGMAHQMQVSGMWSFATERYAWAAWPKGAAWLQSAHYLLGAEAGARLFNWFTLIVTSLLVYRESLRLAFCTSSTSMSIALFLSTPVAFWCAFVLFDDAVFGLLVTAAIIAAVNSSTIFTPRGVFVTLLLCSAAMATKITGLVIMPVIAFVYFLRFVLNRAAIWRRLTGRNFIRYIWTLLPILAIGVIPYLVAYVKTGNPVLPLYNDIFKSENFPVERFQDLRWNAPLGWDAVFKMAANTSEFMEGGNWTFGVQHALFLIPVAVEIFLRRKNIAILQYGLAIVVCFILIFFQARYARYLYPIFPVYTILLASFLHRVRTGGFFRYIIVATSILAIIINLINVKSLNMYYSFDLNTLSPVDSRKFTDYFEKSLNETINLEYGAAARVLYLHRPYSAGLDGVTFIYHWSSPLIRGAIDNVKNEVEAIQAIKKFGITHIIIDAEIMKSVSTPFTQSIGTFSKMQRQQGTAQLWKVDTTFVMANEKVILSKKKVKDLLLIGWREPEPWGVWAYGESARITAHLSNRAIESPVHVRVLAVPYAPKNRTDDIKVEISVNGKVIEAIALHPQQEQMELSFTVPASLLGNSDILDINFLFSKAFDSSQLQLGFSEITYDYK